MKSDVRRTNLIRIVTHSDKFHTTFILHKTENMCPTSLSFRRHSNEEILVSDRTTNCKTSDLNSRKLNEVRKH